MAHLRATQVVQARQAIIPKTFQGATARILNLRGKVYALPGTAGSNRLESTLKVGTEPTSASRREHDLGGRWVNRYLEEGIRT